MQSFSRSTLDRVQGGRCKSAPDTPACSRCWKKQSRPANNEILRVLCRLGFPDRWAMARSTSIAAFSVTPDLQAAQSTHASVPTHSHDGHAIDRVKLYRQAKSLQDAGRADQALEVLMYGLNHLPTDRHFLSLASTLLLKSDQLDAATHVLQTARTHHPKHSPFVTASAMLATKKGHHAEAVNILQAGLVEQPANAVLRQALGEVYQSMGQPEAARAQYSMAISLKPNMPHTYAAWAKLEAATGNVQSARSVYQKGTKAVPDNSPLLHAWATLEKAHGNTDEAKRILHRALAANPQHIPSYMLLGQLLWNEGNQAEARAVWHRGNNTAAGPSAALMCCWAQREMRVFNLNAARELLHSARAVNPNHTRASSLLASLEDRAGNTETAQRLYASALNPKLQSTAFPTQQRQRQEVYNSRTTSAEQQQQLLQLQQHVKVQEQEQSEQSQECSAVDACQSILSTPEVLQGDVPNDSQNFQIQVSQLHQSPIPVLHSMCHHLLKRGEKQQCSVVLEHMLHREPQNGFVCHMAGLLAQKEGRWADATAWFKQGCHTQGREGSLLCWEGLAELLAFLGQPDKARKVLQAGAAYAGTQIYSSNWGCRPASALPLSAASSSRTSSPLKTTSTAINTDDGLSQSNSTAPASHNSSANTQLDVHLHDLTLPSHSSHQPVTPTATPNIAHQDMQTAPTHRTSNSTSTHSWETDWMDNSPGLHSTANEVNIRDGISNLPGVTSRYLRQWGLFEKKNGDMSAAARLFELASIENPQDVRTWLVWAMFERKRDTALAEHLFKRGLAVAPRNPMLWFSYADMLWRQKGNVNAARDVLRRATKICPRSIPLWLEWALLEWKAAGDPEAALELLNKGAATPGGDKHGPLQEALTELNWELGDRRKWSDVRRFKAAGSDERQQADEANMVSIW